MKSKASFKSHPLHPILVSFPIAFLIGTFVSDVIADISGNNSFCNTGYYLVIAGIIMGLIAAIAGFDRLSFYRSVKKFCKKTRSETCTFKCFASYFIFYCLFNQAK